MLISVHCEREEREGEGVLDEFEQTAFGENVEHVLDLFLAEGRFRWRAGSAGEAERERWAHQRGARLPALRSR